MRALDTDMRLDPSPTCVSCHDVIGVYEALVHVIDGSGRETSRAAEPSVTAGAGACYHLGCFDRLADRP